jgi:nicotinamidase/pyrazinamidase
MKQALLIIDMLNDFLRAQGTLYCGAAAEAIIPAVAARLQQARQAQELVIYVCDQHRPDDPEFQLWPAHCVEGTWGAQIVDELAPQEGDLIVPKRRYSGFFGTYLLGFLREYAVEALELCGVCTNVCVLFTAADARNLAYPVTVSALRVATFDPQAHTWALRQMRDVLAVKVVDWQE